MIRAPLNEYNTLNHHALHKLSGKLLDNNDSAEFLIIMILFFIQVV